MSKPNKRRFKLSQIRQQVADERGGSTIDIETDDGQVYSMPAPGFWDDEVTELLSSNDNIKLAEALLGGPENYARFKASGGRAQDVALVMTAYGKDQGSTEGESSASPSS